MKRLWGRPQSFLNKGRVEKYISSGTSTGGLVTLSLWKFALCQKNSLSEPQASLNFSDTLLANFQRLRVTNPPVDVPEEIYFSTLFSSKD